MKIKRFSANTEYYLMLENSPVLYFNFDDIEVKIINKKLLPFFLRGKIIEPESDNIKEFYRVNSRNIDFIKEYSVSRLLSLSRENAKQIYTACGISQDNSIENRLNICFLCKGISINDSYWFKRTGTNEKWEDVDIRNKHLNEIVEIALAGESPTVTTDPMCPELTTKGLFRKAWIRENGKFYLLKSDKTKEFVNTQAELLASKILDCTDIEHVKYTIYKNSKYNMLIAKCKNFVYDGKSFVEAHEVMEYCKDMNIDFTEFALNKFGKDFANIAIIDYIIQNTDRHDQNYGFLMNNETGELERVAPLFDHNQALIADFLGKDVSNTLSQMLNGKGTIEEIMIKFLPYSEIKINYEKWKQLKKENKYKRVLEKVEERFLRIQEIKKGKVYE